MLRSTLQSSFFLTALGGSLLLLSGCAGLHGPELNASTAGRYRNVSLAYKSTAVQQQSVTETPPGQLASFEQPVGKAPESQNASADGNIRTVRIQYPHPNGKANHAQASYVVESSRTEKTPESWTSRLSGQIHQALKWMPGIYWAPGVVEAWALDIPQSELDTLVDQLAKDGFYQAPTSGDPAVQIDLNIDGHRLAKGWRQSAELEKLAARVRAEGRLISYIPANESPSAATVVAAHQYPWQVAASLTPGTTDTPQANAPAILTPSQPASPVAAPIESIAPLDSAITQIPVSFAQPFEHPRFETQPACTELTASPPSPIPGVMETPQPIMAPPTASAIPQASAIQTVPATP